MGHTRAVAEHLIVPYEVAEYPFADLAAEVLEVDRLADLAGRPGPTWEDNFALRDRLGALGDEHPLIERYRALVERVVGPAFGTAITYNRVPHFRVHLPGTPSVSAWHRDAEVTHRPDYVTAWVPFVDVTGETALWVESDYGRGDHAPVPVRYGEILVFDGALLSHGSRPNTGVGFRVSMDFRFVPRDRGGGPAEVPLFAGRPPGLAEGYLERPPSMAPT